MKTSDTTTQTRLEGQRDRIFSQPKQKTVESDQQEKDPSVEGGEWCTRVPKRRSTSSSNLRPSEKSSRSARSEDPMACRGRRSEEGWWLSGGVIPHSIRSMLLLSPLLIHLTLDLFPKWISPNFDGDNLRLSKEQCELYFEIYCVTDAIKPCFAALNFISFAATWLQTIHLRGRLHIYMFGVA